MSHAWSLGQATYAMVYWQLVWILVICKLVHGQAECKIVNQIISCSCGHPAGFLGLYICWRLARNCYVSYATFQRKKWYYIPAYDFQLFIEITADNLHQAWSCGCAQSFAASVCVCSLSSSKIHGINLPQPYHSVGSGLPSYGTVCRFALKLPFFAVDCCQHHVLNLISQ